MNRHTTASTGGSNPGLGLGRIVLIALCALCLSLFMTAAASAAAPTYNSSFDGSGTPAGSMSPTKAAVDEVTGDVYVIDSANGVIDKFSSSGTYLSQILGSSTTRGSFGFGGEDDITVDNTSGATQGNVYVVSEGAQMIFAFDKNGNFLWQSDFSTGGHDMCGISVDTSGNPWASDFNTDQLIQLSTSDGSVTGTHVVIIGNSLCETSFDPLTGTDVYLNAFDAQVQKFPVTPGNGGVTALATIDPGPNFDVATDSRTGDVFTVHSQAVTMYDRTGTAVPGTPFSNNGTDTLTGVTVDGVARKAYVVNSTAHGIDVYDLSPARALTAGTTGAGTGVMTCDGSACTPYYDDGAVVTLDVAADPGSTFTGWSVSGDPTTTCTGTASPCTVTMSADVTVTANFDQNAPSATTGAVSGISQTGATVGGTVNPNGNTVTDCHVDYGTTASYGSQAPCASSPGSGTSAMAVSATLSGLSAGTTYHYRVVATNGGGTADGADATFKTQSATVTPPPPTCATDPSLCPPPPVIHAGVFKLAGRATITVKGGKAPVKLTCKGDTACSGKVKLTLVVKVRKGKRFVKKTLTIASANVTIAAGKSKTVSLRLSRTAQRLLTRSHSLKVTLIAPKLKHALVLKAPKPRHKKK